MSGNSSLMDRAGEVLRELESQAFEAGFRAGWKRAMQTIIGAAAMEPGALTYYGTDTGNESSATTKAPRGSVERVVKAGAVQFPSGFTIDTLMSFAKSAGLPDVSDGSVRNYLRALEKDGKAARVDNVWVVEIHLPMDEPDASENARDTEHELRNLGFD